MTGRGVVNFSNKCKDLIGFNTYKVFVDPAGFEPTYTEPKSVVLPLDDGSMFLSKNRERKNKQLPNFYKRYIHEKSKENDGMGF